MAEDWKTVAGNLLPFTDTAAVKSLSSADLSTFLKRQSFWRSLGLTHPQLVQYHNEKNIEDVDHSQFEDDYPAPGLFDDTVPTPKIYPQASTDDRCALYDRLRKLGRPLLLLSNIKASKAVYTKFNNVICHVTTRQGTFANLL